MAELTNRPQPMNDTTTGVESDSNIAARLAAIDAELLASIAKRLALLQSSPTSHGTMHRPNLKEQIASLGATIKELEKTGTNLPEATIAAMRNLIAASMHSLQRGPAIAFLGPEYSYSYLATIRFFSDTASLSPVSSIPAVFEEVLQGRAKFGVVPIENSTDGRIVDTLTMFAKHPVRICGEVLLPIHHCLLGSSPLEKVTEVHSKPQALSQCRQWLSRHLPQAKLCEISSTTAAVKLAVEKPHAAAIAALEAGMHYGLELIQANIEDNTDNVTRFAVLGQDETQPTGKDKTSIMFQIPHRSGALAEAMRIFSELGLNMTWIESFPIPGNRQEYLFFIEFEGHREEPVARRALETLSQQTLRLEVLGSYPRGQIAIG